MNFVKAQMTLGCLASVAMLATFQECTVLWQMLIYFTMHHLWVWILSWLNTGN